MRRFRFPGSTPPGSQGPYAGTFGMSPAEKRRLRGMVVGLVLVVVMLIAGWWKSSQRGDEGAAELPADGKVFVEKVEVPRFDPAELDALVADREPRSRVVIERAALDRVLPDVRRLTEEGFRSLGVRPLDRELAERIVAAPSSFRGQAFSARGEVLSLRSRAFASGQAEQHLGLIELEDGGHAWFLSLEDTAAEFAHVEGIFLEVYRAEEDGEWIDAPLLVTPRVERSWPRLRDPEAFPREALAAVHDDVLVKDDGSQPTISGIPFEALWILMAHVRAGGGEAVDWEAAPELDAGTLSAMLRDGEPFRGRPFRLPLSRLQGVRVRRAGENPARIERYTEGWIGNATWNNVVHFLSPEVRPDLARRDYVRARGFFLKDFAYESAGRGLRIAPVFVLDGITEFVPEPDPTVRALMLTVVVGAVLMIHWLAGRVQRDRRRSKQLEEKLLERRRERRAQAARATVPPAATDGAPGRSAGEDAGDRPLS